MRGPCKQRRRGRGVVAAAMLLAGVCLGPGLGGCSISLSDMPFGGNDAPAKNDAESFPAVNDLPNRDEAVLAPAERNKIEQELIAARERQANANAAAAAAATPAKPAASR